MQNIKKIVTLTMISFFSVIFSVVTVNGMQEATITNQESQLAITPSSVTNTGDTSISEDITQLNPESSQSIADNSQKPPSLQSKGTSQDTSQNTTSTPTNPPPPSNPNPKPTPPPSNQCIITIDGNRYNVANFKNQHTGGDIFVCDTDMTKTFYSQHDKSLLTSTMIKYKLN